MTPDEDVCLALNLPYECAAAGGVDMSHSQMCCDGDHDRCPGRFVNWGDGTWTCKCGCHAPISPSRAGDSHE